MRLKTLQPKKLKGVVFDGKFDSAVDLVKYIDKHRQGKPIENLTIERFSLGNIHGKTNLSFEVDSRKITLNHGDFLVFHGNSFKRIGKDNLDEWFKTDLQIELENKEKQG